MTFENRPNIVLWHSKSYFAIRTWADYRILTFNILFWPSKLGGMSYFDIQNPNIRNEPNIVFDLQILTLTFELRWNIVFWHLKSYFDIQTEADFCIWTFWHSYRGRISYFDIQNPIFTLEIGPNIVFWHSKSYFDLRLRPNIVFWHSKSYFDIRNRARYRILTFKILFCVRTEPKYRILTFKILFWHSYWGRISYFDIQNPILTFEMRPIIVFRHSKS